MKKKALAFRLYLGRYPYTAGPSSTRPLIFRCYVGLEKSNKNLVYGSNRNEKGYGLWLREEFPEPDSGEAERETEFEH